MKSKLTMLVLVLLQWGAAQAGRVLTDSVQSKVLGATVKYNVYLPDGYEQSSRMYPIVYLLHGLSDDHTAWLNNGRMNWVADELIKSGGAREMVIVMPKAGSSDIHGTQCGYFNVKGWAYEDFFLQEFMPQVEEKYHIVSDRGHRAIMGLSMGGGGSTVYCQRHPDLFCACFSMSGWLSEDGFREEPADKQDCLYRTCESVHQHSAIDYVKNADEATLKQLRTVQWFFDCGDDDYLLDVNVAMHQQMRNRGIRHEFRVRDGNHNWEYWHYSLRMALPFVSRSFSALPPVK